MSLGNSPQSAPGSSGPLRRVTKAPAPENLSNNSSTTNIITPDERQRVINQAAAIAKSPEFQKYNLNTIPLADLLNLYTKQEMRAPISPTAKEFLMTKDPFRNITEKRRKEIKDAKAENFNKSIETPFAVFLEVLPFLANAPGRISENLTIESKKTADSDDQSCSRVDNIWIIKNLFDYTNLDLSAFPDIKKDTLKKQITVLVDVTTNPGPDGVKAKESSLAMGDLGQGKKSEVLAYSNAFGVPGISAPKVVVYISEEQLNKFSHKIRHACVITDAGLTIKDPEVFNAAYREFFEAYMKAVSESCEKSIVVLSNKIRDLEEDAKKRNLSIVAAKAEKKPWVDLRQEYVDIVNFLNVMQITPQKKS